jgi:hypothetical protein
LREKVLRREFPKIEDVLMINSFVHQRRAIVSIPAAMLFLVGWASPGGAQQTDIDIQALIKETQQQSQSKNELTLVWWMPEEFFRAAMSKSQNLPPDKVEELLKPLKVYTILLVIDAKMGMFGKPISKPDAELVAEVQIRDGAGNLYAPLDDKQLNDDAKTFIGIMKPMMANMLGALGESMHFFVFPSHGKEGAIIAQANKEGVFYAEIGKQEFRWKLPLGSVLPRKTCPTCKESMSGAYKYCPFDGTKLPEPPSSSVPSAINRLQPAGLNLQAR